MCGILGIYRNGGLTRQDIGLGMLALKAIEHRGPDGEGMALINTAAASIKTVRLPATPLGVPCDGDLKDIEWEGADLLLGHRRLSIFDLSINGHQPMRDGHGNVIVFNGEIYNFLEIRDLMAEGGAEFATGTDTEVILAAYQRWGSEALRRFNGMWSFLLYDSKEQRLLVSVDRIGEKQLYVYEKDGLLVFASEIKAIRAVVQNRLSIHPENVRHFLAHGNIDIADSTLFQEIRRFPPSNFSYVHPKDFSSTAPVSYWELPLARKSYESVQQAADVLRSLIDDSIRLRMRSDVPWGTTLSGGLDSSSIIYAAKAIREKESITEPINTFTAIFPGQAGDESMFVKRIEAEIGTKARYVNPLEEFDFDDFKRFLHHQDLPVVSTSMYAQWSVMKLVGGSEVKVLLDGQGGDELFAGYHHHAYKLGRSLLMSGRLLAFNRLVKDFSSLKGLDPAQVRKFILDDVKLYLRLKTGYTMPGPPEVTAWNKALDLQSVLIQDLRSWVMPMLLRYEDRNSMAFSIEARLPFLDYRIIEFAMQLPDEFKIHQGWQKYILRLAMPDLPDLIRWRKDKKGFTTPHDAWVKQFHAEFVALAEEVGRFGIEIPFEEKDVTKLEPSKLFRMASLGFWLKERGAG